MTSIDRNHSSRSCRIGSVCLGIVIGSLLAYILLRERRPSPVTAPDGLRDTITQIAADLEELKATSEAFIRGEHGIDNDLVRLEQTSSVGVGQQQSDRVAVGRDGEQSNRPGRDVYQWIGVLDKDVARVLVERGLTPFDPEVSRHVRMAGDSLRDADSRYASAIKPLMEAFNGQQINVNTLSESSAPLEQQRDTARRAAIERLCIALDGINK